MKLVDPKKALAVVITREEIINRYHSTGRYKPSDSIVWLVENHEHAGAECLAWPFYRGVHGYGRLAFGGGRTIHAHRLMCTLAHGTAPSDRHVVSHICNAGREGCVNPRHLEWVTTREHSQWKSACGRQPVGTRAYNSKLTTEQVRAIRARPRQEDAHVRKLAAEYQVSKTSIERILRGESYLDVA